MRTTKTQISLRIRAASEAAQPGLSLTWSETPETGFLVTRMLCVYKSPIGIIVTAKHCFYFISCTKAIPEDAKLHSNEKVLSTTEIYRTTAVNVPFSSLQLTICSILITAVTALLYKLCIYVCTIFRYLKVTLREDTMRVEPYHSGGPGPGPRAVHKPSSCPKLRFLLLSVH